MVNPYDKAARYAAKMDPPEYFDWALQQKEPFVFDDWLDTRTIPFPSQEDRVCDTVARLNRTGAGAVPIAAIVEFQSRQRAEILERVVEYALRLRRELRYGPNRRSKYDCLPVVVNLTGRRQRGVLNLTIRERGGKGIRATIDVVTMSAEDAAKTLDRINKGEIGRSILPCIPLMSGAKETSIIKQWKKVARKEPNSQRRSDYAALALIFAELAGCYDEWKTELKGWNMMQSKQVLEWESQGQTKHARKILLELLELRLPDAIPRKFRRRVNNNENLDELNSWIKAAATAEDWDSFSKQINGA